MLALCCGKWRLRCLALIVPPNDDVISRELTCGACHPSILHIVPAPALFHHQLTLLVRDNEHEVQIIFSL